MSKEQGILNQIIRWLADRQRWTRGQSHRKALDIFELLFPTYRPVGDNLEAKLAENEPTLDLLEEGNFIYLTPVEKQGWMVPVLSIMYNFSGSKPVVRLRLALFLLDENDTLKAIGYRFETPESNVEVGEKSPVVGDHDYYHAQLINGFDKTTQRWQLPCELWLPTSWPAFPLDAEDPVGLIVCLLVSLYGLNYISATLGTTPFKNELKSHIKKMTLDKFRLAPAS